MPKKPGHRPVRSSSPAGAPTSRRRVVPRPTTSFPVSSAEPKVTPPPARVAPTEPAARPTPMMARPETSGRVTPLSARVPRVPRSSAMSMSTDYSYVMSDLRRIGLLAVVAFAILGGLTLVIH